MTDAETEPDEEPARLPDLEAIVPELEPITINGLSCYVNRIRTREMLMLLKILTRSMGVMFGPMMQQINWGDDKEAREGLLGMFIGAMPEVPDETIAFVRAVVTPNLESVELPVGQAVAELNATMTNPDIDVLIAIISRVVEQEWDDLAAIVGKVRTLVKTLEPMTKTNTSATPPSRKRGGSGRGRARST